MELDSVDFQKLLDTYIIPWGINLVFAVVVFVVGRYITKLIVRASRRIMLKAKLDDALVSFLASILKTVLMVVVIIAALDRLGIDTTSIMAIFAAAGLAVGLALKESLANFSSGVMLILFKPFGKDDTIEAAGIMGVVEKISVFSTLLRTPDNREIIVPNSKIYGDTITNYSARDTRRIDLVIGIGYDDDIKTARSILEKIIKADSRILEEPAAVIMLLELADSSINFAVRPWVKSGDYWNVRADLLESIKNEFDSNNVSIPYPQRDVHLFQQEK